MMKYLHVILMICAFNLNLTAQSCCPEILKSSLSSGTCIVTNGGSCGMCKDAEVTFSVENGNNLPAGGQLSWYYSTTPVFNPAIGQGTLIGTVNIPDASCDNASSVKFNEVMVKPANNDDDMVSPTTGEWIELIGPPGTDISCYIISDGDWAITIPPGYSIQSDGLFVIGFTATAGSEVDLDVAGCNCTTGNPNKVLTLDNGGEWLAMFDGVNTIDAFQYGNPSLFNSFPFGDLISGGTIPGANLIGCVQNYTPGFPSFTNYSPTTPTGQSYARKPDFSGGWSVSCPTIGKCNSGGNIYPLQVQSNFSGIACNQTIYIKGYVTPTPNGCSNLFTPQYSLFISCPESDFKKTLCAKESITVNGNVYDINNPTGTEIITGGSYLGCDSTIHVDLSFNPEVTASIAGDFQICLGQSVSIPIQFTGTPPFTFTYKLNGLPLNTVTTSSNPYILKFNPIVSGEISLSDLTDKSNCEGETSGIANVDVDAPTATLNGKKIKVCEGDTVLIPVKFFGYPDFTYKYAVNGNVQPEIKTGKLSDTISIVATTTSIISIKEMTDDQGCLAKITGQDTIIVLPKIKINNLTETCYPGNTYDVSFTLTGGDTASWQVIGPGTLKDSVFTSSSFTGGTSYMFIIKDNSGCNIDTISNTVKCNCQNSVGTMDQTLLHACINETVMAAYDSNGQILGAGDILQYILHENNGNSPGKIWAQNSTPEFNFVVGMTPGTIYYISAVIGKENPPGVIDLSDECLQTAKGTPVVFHNYPSITLSPDTSVCIGSCIDITNLINGNAPYDIEYSMTSNVGTNYFNTTSPTDTMKFTYCPPPNNGNGITSFTFTSIKDKYCTAAVSESMAINVGTATSHLLNKDLCYGQSITVNGTVYSETNPTGTETLSGANVFGCDSIIMVNLNFVQTVVENYTTTICQGKNVIINGTVFDANNTSGSFSFPGGSVSGCDSILNVSIGFYPASSGLLKQTLCNGESITLNGKKYDINNPTGFENLAGQAWNGCDSLVEVQLSFLPPAFKLLRDTLCKGESITVNGTIYDFNKPAGLEIFKNGSSAGCDSTVQVQLVFENEITAFISGPDTICPGSNLEIILNFSSAGTFDVVINDGKGQNLNFPSVSDGFKIPLGQYISPATISLVSVTAASGNCSVTSGPDLNIAIGTFQLDITALSDFNGFNISCTGASDGSAQVGITGGTGPFNYLWSGGQSTASISNSPAGNYSVTVSDTDGCSANATITLTEPAPLDLQIETTTGKCDGTSGGSILVKSISGGTGNYFYSLNPGTSNVPIKAGDVIPNLAEGSYEFLLQDENGCQLTENITITQGTSANLFVDAGPDLTLETNQRYGIDVTSNVKAHDIKWYPPYGLDCSNCLNPVVMTDSTTTYIVTITDQNGCSATDSITVFILSPDILYVPNVFSPDGDGINDRLPVFTGNRVKSIKKMEIFDRWGERLFSRENMPVNDPESGWDGKHRGQRAIEGVYVYYIIVELNDGKERLFKGDVSIIR